MYYPHLASMHVNIQIYIYQWRPRQSICHRLFQAIRPNFIFFGDDFLVSSSICFSIHVQPEREASGQQQLGPRDRQSIEFDRVSCDVPRPALPSVSDGISELCGGSQKLHDHDKIW